MGVEFFGLQVESIIRWVLIWQVLRTRSGLASLSGGARGVTYNSRMDCARHANSHCLDVTISVTLTGRDYTEKLAYYFF